jgi:predicted PurR-regulated permease PerM
VSRSEPVRSIDPEEPVLRPAADRRAVAVTVLATLGVIAALRAGREVFVPIVLGIILTYALEPVVGWLTRLRVPRPLGAAIVLAGVVGTLALGTYALQDDALALVDSLPSAARQVREQLRVSRGGAEGPIEKMRTLASEIERGAAEAAGVEVLPRGVTRVQLEEKPLDVRAALLSGSRGAIGLAGQAILLLFLVYFLLASGDLYRRKLVRMAGPSLSRKKVTLEALEEIGDQIQRVLFVQILTGVVVGVASWLAFRWMGLGQAAVWGVAAGVLNSIPYFGPVIVMSGVALAGFFQFGTLSMALAFAGVAFAITSLEGYFLTPWLVGRAVQMNQVAVFIGLLFWGWLWGIVGLLLAVPMLVVVKSIADRVEDLRPIGELLGE